METVPLNVASLSKKEFDNKRVKPDNWLFFVYDEQVGEDGKVKTRIRLYKGAVLVSGDVNITNIIQGEGGGNALEAGKAYFLEPFEEPVIEIRDGKYIDVGIPPYEVTLKAELNVEDIKFFDTDLGTIGYTDSNIIHNAYKMVPPLEELAMFVQSGYVTRINYIIENPTDYPLYVLPFAFGDTWNSSSDNVLFLLPRGKGIVKCYKTNDEIYQHRVKISEVYPRPVMNPEVVYEVMFKGTDNVVYDRINNIETSVTGENLSYSQEDGLTGTMININLVGTEDGNENKLDAILRKYGYHFVIQFIGVYDDYRHTNPPNNTRPSIVVTWISVNGIFDDGPTTNLCNSKFHVVAPYRSYSVDNLDYISDGYWDTNAMGIRHAYKNPISQLYIGLGRSQDKTWKIKGIRIIAGAPADIKQMPGIY